MAENNKSNYNIIQDGCGTFGIDYVLDEKGIPVTPNRSCAQSQPKCIEDKLSINNHKTAQFS